MSFLALGNFPATSRAFERLSEAKAWVTDLVFPPTCGGCGRVDFQFCPACADSLSSLPIAFLQRQVEYIDAVYATGTHEGILRDAIRAFKYGDAPQLAEALAARLEALIACPSEPIDALTPVPLSSERLAERGYNQSELLANRLGAACLLPCRPNLLRRVRHTEKQAQLRGEERNHNVKGAFAAEGAQGSSILLVDDVVTTGSTLRECALALRENGATAVYALAVSRSR